MLRLLLLLTGVVLLMADYSFAQDSPDPTPMQCQLIKLTVAQNGFAARLHALETYGPEAVKTGDKCFTNVRLRLRASTKNAISRITPSYIGRPTAPADVVPAEVTQSH
jgi:hypothetical protein